MSVYDAILQSLIDALRYFPMTRGETMEMQQLIRQAQDVLLRSWDRLKQEYPELQAEGLWPYLDRLKEHAKTIQNTPILNSDPADSD